MGSSELVLEACGGWKTESSCRKSMFRCSQPPKSKQLPNTSKLPKPCNPIVTPKPLNTPDSQKGLSSGRWTRRGL